MSERCTRTDCEAWMCDRCSAILAATDPENPEAVERVARAIYDADQYLEANPWQAAARAVLAALRREGQ